jgi:hypothetical protein
VVGVTDALVPAPATGLITSAPVAQVIAMQDAYHELCNGLLDDSDYATIGDKRFRNKSGWRKLAVAFNVSDGLIEKEIHRDKDGRVIAAEMVVRATAPNGRFMDGYGACDIHDRCCDPQTCKLLERWADSGKLTGHVHCMPDCNGRHAFSNPSHDVPSTAMTRATNRAFADLFGMGEVSAEEVSRNAADPATGEMRSGPGGVGESRPRAQTTQGPSRNSAYMEQIDFIVDQLHADKRALFNKYGWNEDQGEPTTAQCRAVLSDLRARKEARTSTITVEQS